MKLIREARMGRPKQGKSGVILATYPKPMLYYQLDRSGVDIVPSKNIVFEPSANIIPFDTKYEEIKFVRSHDFGSVVNLPMEQQAKITVVDFTKDMPSTIELGVKPSSSALQYTRIVEVHNQTAGKPELPWKTIVLDSATGLTDAVLSYIASVNPNAFADARQWAGQAGDIVRKVVLAMTAVPCHFVCLLHSNVDVNEITKEVTEDPSLYGKALRSDFFGLFSQVFYAYKDPLTGLPMVQVSDQYPVKGIGPRFPLGLPRPCKPDFQSIYGKELL